MKNEIKGILVHFFREGTKGDYLESLNKAQDELLTVIEARKNLVQPDVNGQLAEHECKFYVNANWTGYSRCSCGKEHKG